MQNFILHRVSKTVTKILADKNYSKIIKNALYIDHRSLQKIHSFKTVSNVGIFNIYKYINSQYYVDLI